MEIVERIKKELEEFNKKREALCTELRTEFPNLFKELLATSNRINSFSWTQYTPYFNDGDECSFSVNNEDIDINDIHPDDIDEEDADESWRTKGVYGVITAENIEQHRDFNLSGAGYTWYGNRKVGDEGYFPNPDYDVKENKIVAQIVQVLTSIPDDFYRDLFGDHKKVTVYKSGEIEVEDYDHD